MRYLFGLFLSLAFLFIEFSLPAPWFVYMPRLSFLTFVFFSFYYGFYASQLIGFTLGIFLDFFTGFPLGFTAFIYITVGVLVSFFQGRLNYRAWSNYAILSIFSLIIQAFLVFLLASVVDFPLLGGAFPLTFSLLITLLIAPLYGRFLIMVLRVVSREKDDIYN